MNGIRLSVCIATRNRADMIGDTIRSIASQMRPDVEILVLDGASTDATPQVMSALCAEVPRLRYLPRATNGGIDRDYDAAACEASGEYCWLMSDDDVVLPGAIDAVLAAISTGRDLVIVNAEMRDLRLVETIDADRLRFDADRLYGPDELDRLFVEVSGYLGYIGAVVIRRALWLERDRARYFGSYFIHVGVIFQAPLPHGAIALHRPLVAVRFGNTQWRPKEFEIRMIRWTELVASLDAVAPAIRRSVYRERPWRSIKSLLFYRAKGTYDIEEYRRWIKPRAHSSVDRAKALLVACVPGMVANLVGLIYCRLPYRDANIHLLDMKASRFFYRNRMGKILG
ncbi:glycosyltransferase family 2 protein [Lysobacter sp. HA35]